MTDEPFDWSPGNVRLQQDGPDRRVLVIFCGEGLYRGMLRVGKTTLQYAPQRYDEPRVTRTWKDATEPWPAFPAWLRRDATDRLHLIREDRKA